MLQSRSFDKHFKGSRESILFSLKLILNCVFSDDLSVKVSIIKERHEIFLHTLRKISSLKICSLLLFHFPSNYRHKESKNIRWRKLFERTANENGNKNNYNSERVVRWCNINNKYRGDFSYNTESLCPFLHLILLVS